MSISNVFATAVKIVEAVEFNRSVLKDADFDTTTFSAITKYPVFVSDELCGGFACAYNKRLHGVDAIVVSRGIYTAYIQGNLVDFISALIKHEEGHIVCRHNYISKFAFVYKMLTKGYDESTEYEADAYSIKHGYDMAYAITELKAHYLSLGPAYAHVAKLFDDRLALIV